MSLHPWIPLAATRRRSGNLWRRFQSQPRWRRWTAYGATTVVGLAVVGGIVGAGDEESGQERTSLSTAVVPVTAVESTAPPTATSVTAHPAPPSSTVETTTASTTTTSTSTTTTTTTTLAPTTTEHGSVRALDVLAFIPILNEHQAGYDRDRFGYPADQDGDECDTRAEVLIRDSSTPAQVDSVGCTVLAGDWDSAYDDRTWTDPAELEIDHVVALKEAHDSGAWQWSSERLTAYANDLEDRAACARSPRR